MASTKPNARILLVDDGELDGVVEVLESQGLDYERLRGGGIPDRIAPPLDLLIVTPRHVERVRRGSPPAAQPGRPLRIIAVGEDSPAMRRRLRRAGLHLLVRLPASAGIWQMLIARALYRGSERREDERVAVGSPVAIGDTADLSAPSKTILVDLSNRGCRLQTDMPFVEGDAIAFTLPAGRETNCGDQPLRLRGIVRRIVFEAGSNLRALAVVFDAEMPEIDRTRLTALINRWASGPSSIESRSRTTMPAIPPCQMAALPDLTLDDETDPPIAAQSEIQVLVSDDLGGTGATPSNSRSNAEEGEAEKRSRTRGRFESTLVAEGDDGPVVLIGRDLSAGGMRIERLARLEIGERLRLSLHGPQASDPFVIDARVARDDGEAGYALVFDDLDPETAVELEKLVACLPDVESLEEGELGGLGAVLSQIIRD